MSSDNEQVFWGIHCEAFGDPLFLQKNYIGIGWPQVGDLRNITPNRDGFKKKISDIYPQYVRGQIVNSASQLYRFVHEMKTGDLAIYRSKVGRQIHIGKINGEYEYRPDLDKEYVNVRSVKWIGVYPLTQFSQGALYELGSALTLFQVKNYADEYRAAMSGESKPIPAPEDASAEDETVAFVAGDIEQNTRDFIFKQLAQHLKGYGFQSFVAHLLTTMGYRTVESPEGTDGGVDIIAHKDELKLEPPIIKVQVKSTEGSIGGPEVKQLSGNLGQGEVGLLVTLGNYSRQAIDFAKNRPNLRLIDGDELIQFILTHYEQLDPKYKRLLPLKKVYVPEPVGEESVATQKSQTAKA
ncbi:MAG: restriction endonuclease [Candidatus Korobacteraceae bacterium]